jgi:hypothetical protein
MQVWHMGDGSLLPVIVGGLIGLAGGVIGPWFLQKGKDATDRKRQRREKFEELVTGLFDYEHWLNVVRDMYLYSSVSEVVPTLPPSPFAKLHAIAVVYFPELESKVQELDRAGQAYVSWIYAARRKKLAGEKDFITGYKEAYEAFLKVVTPLRTELSSFAKKELGDAEAHAQGTE